MKKASKTDKAKQRAEFEEMFEAVANMVAHMAKERAEMQEMIAAVTNVVRGKSMFLVMGVLVSMLGASADSVLEDHNPPPETRSALLKLRAALIKFTESIGGDSSLLAERDRDFVHRGNGGGAGL